MTVSRMTALITKDELTYARLQEIFRHARIEATIVGDNLLLTIDGLKIIAQSFTDRGYICLGCNFTLKPGTASHQILGLCNRINEGLAFIKAHFSEGFFKLVVDDYIDTNAGVAAEEVVDEARRFRAAIRSAVAMDTEHILEAAPRSYVEPAPSTFEDATTASGGGTAIDSETQLEPVTLQAFLDTHQPSSPVSDLLQIAQVWIAAASAAPDRGALEKNMRQISSAWHVPWHRGSSGEVMEALKACMDRDSHEPHDVYRIRCGDVRWGQYGEIHVEGSGWAFTLTIEVRGCLHVLGKASESDIYYFFHL